MAAGSCRGPPLCGAAALQAEPGGLRTLGVRRQQVPMRHHFLLQNQDTHTSAQMGAKLVKESNLPTNQPTAPAFQDYASGAVDL